MRNLSKLGSAPLAYEKLILLFCLSKKTSFTILIGYHSVPRLQQVSIQALLCAEFHFGESRRRQSVEDIQRGVCLNAALVPEFCVDKLLQRSTSPLYDEGTDIPPRQFVENLQRDIVIKIDGYPLRS